MGEVGELSKEELEDVLWYAVKIQVPKTSSVKDTYSEILSSVRSVRCIQSEHVSDAAGSIGLHALVSVQHDCWSDELFAY